MTKNPKIYKRNFLGKVLKIDKGRIENQQSGNLKNDQWGEAQNTRKWREIEFFVKYQRIAQKFSQYESK